MDFRNIPPVPDHTTEALRELSPNALIAAHRDAQYLATEAQGMTSEASVVALKMLDAVTQEINERALCGWPIFEIGEK